MVKALDQTLVEQIEGICSARGVRLTPQRKRVFELICSNSRASSAYELLEQLKESEPQAKPPTVYRALEFLMEQGFIHRVESTNSFISCCSCNANQHFFQLLICDKCGDVVELQDDTLISLLANNAEKYGFKLTNQVIETHGTCKTCLSE
ncbi:zinc uptake transcriptional repressor Zur [Vibrio vulnificus]|jgi:Fur family zinc uptake transcriptional regulator|uniref:Ferric uptake regulation protein n=3 Tax=Vibrio vulnificus TaxID=672 RepID=A0A087I1T5_VIBVL|nr:MULTISPECIES: zinc uptake transcriptional repressor Zur [Vibrio]EWS68287.1 XRE family transcriptional regulator [Vibrio vulnificus BAA87]OJI55984.1 Zinc uptake regulation protein [Vibrio fluvialis]ALM69763.1 XRE family transcriptional regulator [Vibrio vulnificus]AMG13248.1 transcriptional regulator Zur [Vibrio vulnificus]ANH64432.1 XRE family transcriptional regulator [Vibrio vulnificus]